MAHEVLSRDAVDRMVVTAHRITVPLDWSHPDAGETISVFAREAVAVEHADDSNWPAICWFQGGPGFESPFPESRSGWIEQLLTRYRVVLLDQRGTGMSTPLDSRALPRGDAHELAAYLRNFRADSIVRDADRLRAELYGEETGWYIFGQSFGGFCSLTYLSLLPEHVVGVIITGGFAPVLHDATGVYQALAQRVADRNAAFYKRFPRDAARVRRIVDHLESHADLDAVGQRLTAHRFLALGELFGHAHGLAELHAWLERADHDLDQLGVLSGAVQSRVAELMAPATNPIYSVLHEPCYSNGGATGWAAARVVGADSRFALDAQPAPFFTGEMIFPWMFDELAPLQPLRDAAELISAYDAWPPLYDVERLRANTVPTVGTIYWNDPYVDRELATQTSRLIDTCDVWITSEYEHAAYRFDPRRVAERLFAMLDQLRASS